MNRELLEAPFAPNEVKQRRGRNNKAMDYIEGHTVIQRLNEVLDNQWNFTIVSHEIREDIDSVLVLGKLTAPGVVKMQFGSSQLTRAKETNKIIAVGDDLKAAATDSLKKCATLLGIGLYLYNTDKKPGTGRTGTDHRLQAVPATRSQHPQTGQQNVTSVTGLQQHASRLSQPQHKYLHNLAHKQGLTTSELSLLCQERFGVSVDFLSKEDASAMIAELSRQPSSAQPQHQAQGQVA